MEVRYGNGGWLRVDSDDLPGPLYLRYRSDRGMPVLVEFYLDAHDGEVSSGLFRTLDLRPFTLFAMQGMGEWLDRSAKMPGPDLSRLASHFATGFGSQARHWVADSMRAQVNDSSVPQVPVARLHEPVLGMKQPEPVEAPTSGLDDEFLRSVAANYAWAVHTALRPAPMIATQAQMSVRTVHAWVRKAREKGFLAPTTQGRTG